MNRSAPQPPDSKTPQILVAEDDPFQGELVCRVLARDHIPYTLVTNGRLALDFLAAHPKSVAAVVLDINMPVMDGLQAFEILRTSYPKIPVIFLTGEHDVRNVVDAIKRGAYDFMAKPIDRDRFQITARNAYQLGCLSLQSSPIKWQSSHRLQLDDLIGHDGALLDVIQTARKLAGSDVPIMIAGETGTGKDVFARAIHGESPRASFPFVALNCGAIPDTLIESILFGHEKGAFTGATERTPGKFREAEGGTIFLDEIGDMPMDAQVRLLRVLQQHEVQPVGSAKAVPINVRVISASNRDLNTLVRAGQFREDLLYRLNVVPIHLPPLRQRVNDIPKLVDHFIERYAAEEGLPVRYATAEAVAALIAHDWPGNVRELENVVRRALVLGSGDALYPYDFVLNSDPKTKDLSSLQVPLPQSYGPSIAVLDAQGHLRSMAEIEAEMIKRALHICHGNIQHVAKMLGLARSTIYRKIDPPI